MIIALDMDGPIVDLHKYWIDIYNRDYDDYLTVDKITDWNLARFTKCGNKIFDYLTKPGFFLGPEPTEGAIEAVKELNKNHQVYLVTACSPGPGLEDKCRWVAKHLPFLTREQVIITHHKFMIKSNIMLDDAPEHLQMSETITVAWDELYNKGVKACFRVEGSGPEKWQRFVEIINELERGVYIANLH